MHYASPMPSDLLLRSAVHEAGHAVLGHLRGQSVRHRGLIARRDGTGAAHTRAAFTIPRAKLPPNLLEVSDSCVEMECAVLLAGYVVERRWFRERALPFQRPWSATDYAKVTSTLSTYLGRGFEPLEICLVVAVMEDFTRSFLRRNAVWDVIRCIAGELQKSDGELSDEVANTLLNQHLPGTWMPAGRERHSRPRIATVIPLLLPRAASVRR